MMHNGLSNRKLFPSLHILDSCQTETRDEVEGLRTFNNFTNSSSVYIRLNKHRKKVFYCFNLLYDFNQTKPDTVLRLFDDLSRYWQRLHAEAVCSQLFGRREEKRGGIFSAHSAQADTWSAVSFTVWGQISLTEDLHFSKTVMVS